jgi:hypothetical protein
MVALKETENEVDRAAEIINKDNKYDERKMQLAKNMTTLQATLEKLR